MLSRIQATNLMVTYAIIALTATSIRLKIVRKLSTWRRDDALAVIATSFLLTQSILMSLRARDVPSSANPRVNAMTYYLNNGLFYFQGWTARLAILFSLRNISPTPQIARSLKIAAVPFVVTPVTTFSLMVEYCHRSEDAWSRRKEAPSCRHQMSIVYIYFAAALCADIFLVVTFFRILGTMMLTRKDTFRVKTAFCLMVALLTTATTVQTVVSFFGGGNAGTRGLVTASTETFVAMLVCNAAAVLVVFVQTRPQDLEREPLLSGHP